MVELEVRVVKKEYKFRDEDSGVTIYITARNGCITSIDVLDDGIATKMLEVRTGIGIPIRHAIRLAEALRMIYEKEMKRDESH